ncbi:MAG: hypothetical protein AABZ02_09140, partial [Bacteroidota bacterium]
MKTYYSLLLLFISVHLAFSQKSLYLEEIKKASEKGWQDHPALIDQWKKDYKPSVLWGYNSPGYPIYLASTLAFLYEQTKDKLYAERAAELLASYGDLRNAYPADYWKTRAEYVKGIPAIANFFFMPPYIRAYLRIRESGMLDSKTKRKIEEDL